MILLWIIAAVLIADFVTGLVHWAEDTYCKESFSGFLGREICGPNLLHHKEQLAMLRGGFWRRNYTVMMFTVPVLAIALAMQWWLAAGVLSILSFANEVHGWSHRKPTCPVGRLLQDMAVIQTPRQHSMHHRAPYDSHYCTMTNMLNPILDRLHFWRWLEWVVLLTFRVRPRAV